MTRLGKIAGQVQSELDDFIALCNELQPESYLEVGARDGIALRYFVERVPTIKRVAVVDLPGAKWGRDGSEAQLRDNVAALTDVECTLHIGDSTDPRIIAAASEHSYDVVFIDADHTYEGVLSDYENYGPLANMILAMHDINHPPDSSAYGPTRLWNEVRGPEDVALIDVADSRKGIGVIYVVDRG